MGEREGIINRIKSLCEGSFLHIVNDSAADFRIFTDQSTGITLFLNLESPTKFRFHFLERTNDISYHGDRSDAHVVLSLMFTSFLSKFGSGMSCSLFDIAHPAIEDEIWGRYIMPEQTPDFIGISSWSQVEKATINLIEILVSWNIVFSKYASCPCEKCCRENNIDNYKEYETPKEILAALNKIYKSQPRANY